MVLLLPSALMALLSVSSLFFIDPLFVIVELAPSIIVEFVPKL